MSAGAIVMGILGVLFLWGGTAYFLSIALRKQGFSRRTDEDGKATSS